MDVTSYLKKAYFTEIPDEKIIYQPKENDYGNTEYKRKLIDKDEERMQQLTT